MRARAAGAWPAIWRHCLRGNERTAAGGSMGGPYTGPCCLRRMRVDACLRERALREMSYEYSSPGANLSGEMPRRRPSAAEGTFCEAIDHALL